MTDAPKAVWSGSFSLFGAEVKCHVLDDGRRVIESDSMGDLLNAMAVYDVPDEETVQREIDAIARWLRGDAHDD